MYFVNNYQRSFQNSHSVKETKNAVVDKFMKIYQD